MARNAPPDPDPAQRPREDERRTYSAEEVSQGYIVLRTRRRRMIFFGGLIAAVLLAIIVSLFA